MQYILLSSNFIFVNMRIIYVRRGKWQRLPGPGAGPGIFFTPRPRRGQCPGKTFRPQLLRGHGPGIIFGPGLGGAMAPAGFVGPGPGPRQSHGPGYNEIMGTDVFLQTSVINSPPPLPFYEICEKKRPLPFHHPSPITLHPSVKLKKIRGSKMKKTASKLKSKKVFQGEDIKLKETQRDPLGDI